MKIGNLEVPVYRCERCNWQWSPRVIRQGEEMLIIEPKACPNCKSSQWNEPRKTKKRR